MSDSREPLKRHGHRARRLLRRGVFGIHILQLPLFFGLMLALLVFGVSFFYAIIESVLTLDFLDRDKAILLVLDLLDMVFIANLVVMVMVSAYNAYYVASQLGADSDEQLSYTDEFAPVKSRIAATLVIISGIHVVHELLAGDLEDPRDLLILGALHLVLLATAAVFAYMAKIERGPPADAPRRGNAEEDSDAPR